MDGRRLGWHSGAMESIVRVRYVLMVCAFFGANLRADAQSRLPAGGPTGSGGSGVSVGIMGVVGSDSVAALPFLNAGWRGSFGELDILSVEWSASDRLLAVSNQAETQAKASLALTEGFGAAVAASASSRASLSGDFRTGGAVSAAFTGGSERAYAEFGPPVFFRPSLNWSAGLRASISRDDSLFAGPRFGALPTAKPGAYDHGNDYGPYADLQAAIPFGPVRLGSSLGISSHLIAGVQSGSVDLFAMLPLPRGGSKPALVMISLRTGVMDDAFGWGVSCMASIGSWTLLFASTGLDIDPDRADPGVLMMLSRRF